MSVGRRDVRVRGGQCFGTCLEKKTKKTLRVDTGEVRPRVIECEVLVGLTGRLMSLRYPWPGELPI